MSRRTTLIFQNDADKEELIRLGITNPAQSKLIRGSGVDIDYFSNSSVSRDSFHDPIKLLFPSRIIVEKGFNELLKAHTSLVNKDIKIELLISGEIDNGNRSSITPQVIEQLNINKNIRFLGHVKNMKKLLEDVDIVVLPSWREGLSRALIEAASMEKPILTTDVPGCRDIIEHGYSGILVPPKDPHAIELAILFLIRNQKLAFSLGKKARLTVEKEFKVTKINKETLLQYRKLRNSNNLS